MRRFSSILLALAVAGAVHAKGPAKPTVNVNEAVTARYYASLIGTDPKLAELTMFFTQMPKGGDLHHHYSGALYAETYLDFLDKEGFCVDKTSYAIVSDAAKLAIERAKPVRTCLSGAEVRADDATYRELLQRWSSKDFHNHGALQSPPDRQFFQTFLYFDAVSNTNFGAGLQELKQRAIRENVLYIETMFKKAPSRANPDFDGAIAQGGAEPEALMANWYADLDKDPAFNQNVADFLAKVAAAHQGIDDEHFTMRYQTYVLRLLPPSLVFSTMVSAFKAASQSDLVVGVNIVGQESNPVAMRDYALHMRMFQFLRARYPNVKLALHAGELALGDVPPEGLQFHIEQALNVAGAQRIGHGIDLAHETNAPAILKAMREKDVPVEINLTSNAFISGIAGQNHPLTLYRKYGVPYVIATDDAGVTRHNLSNEYVLFASRYQPTYAEVKRVSYNSLRYAFLPEAQKRRLTQQLDARYAAFESTVAAQVAPR
ncbi:MAG: adenosine deaminase family protein [Gammaproteobacteria bacterium]